MNSNLRTSIWVSALALVAAATFSGSPRARGVDLLSENFNQLPLQQVVTFPSEVRSRAAWTATPPSGAGVEGVWSVDNSAMPANAMASNLIGVTEFEGWTFVDRDWWTTTADDQDRTQFVSANGVIAVADPDEWDDFGGPTANNNKFDSTLKVSNIPLLGAAPNTVNLFFHSSWRFEGAQKASLKVKYNDVAATEITIFTWDSDALSANFKEDATNEAINVPLLNPAGATQASLEFRLFDAGNNWWWALDNLAMFTGAAPAQDGTLRLIINRDTGNVRIVNNTQGTVNLRGYSIESIAGALNESAATYLGDTNASWQIFDNPSSSELSEGYVPNQYAMPTQTANPTLGVINLGNSWRKYFEDLDDISFQYLVAGNNTPVDGIVEFIGNGGNSYHPMDLNFDAQVNSLDYAAFIANYDVSLAGKNTVEAYNLGDFDSDGKHTVNDFLNFKKQFDLVRGPGAFAAAAASGAVVPEPGCLGLAWGALALLAGRRMRRSAAVLAAVVAGCGMATERASASLPLLLENFESVPLGASPEEQPAQTAVWSDVGPAGWTIDRSAMPGIGNPANDGVTDWAGWAVVNKDWWVSAAGEQRREEFSRGTGKVLVADPDEWDDAAHATGKFTTFITSPTITIPAGIPAGKIRIAFDSSWRPEGFDDGDLTNNQTGTLDVSYNSGAFQNVLTFDSNTANVATFHPDNPNEAVDQSLNFNGTSTTLRLKFGLTNALNDWWWAIDNIRVFVPSDPAILRINTTTGMTEIVGGDTVIETINGYDIFSEKGNLAPIGNLGLSFLDVDSVDGPDADSVVGNSITENWQLGAADSNLFSEFFLDGGSTFTTSRTESLGRVFNPATLVGDRDVDFTYTTIYGDIVEGQVEYFAGPANSADFDSSGRIEGRDFLTWQRGFNGPGAFAQGDADSNGTVNGADFTIWKTQFGQTAAAPAGAGVPEPTSLGLLGGAAALLTAVRRRRRATALAIAAAALGLSAGGAQSASAQGAPTLDRNYRFGDADPGAIAGATVNAFTRDEAGVPNMNQLIGLVPSVYSGSVLPRYVAVTDRPDGVSGLGIQLNPGVTNRQFLKTAADEALNFPERSPSSTESVFSPSGTIDYTYITDRGFQLWVKPTATTAASIVMDSNNHGVSINSSGKFSMRYSGFDYQGLTSPVASTWYHLMVVRAFGDGGSGSVLYVNGVAEAAATGIYNGEEKTNDEMPPSNHDNSPLVVGSVTSENPDGVGFSQYFRGTVDDLTMFVMGLNPTNDFGEFQTGRDNKYISHFGLTTAGDLTGDGQITTTDVTQFASNWLYEKRLEWLQGGETRSLVVGDMTTRTRGDFNYDGRVDLADWGVLNTANPAMAAAAMALINGVPEPGTAALALMSLLGASRVVRRTERTRAT